MKQLVQCLHDLLINKELAFKKNVWYVFEDNHVLQGCNGKSCFLTELPVSDPSLYFDLQHPKLIDTEESNVEEIKKKASFSSIVEEMSKTYEAKNHDYGNSFDQSLDEFGLIAAITRMSDKFNRIKALIKSDAKVDESIEDTLLDLANYSVMSLLWLKNKKSS